MDLQARYWTFVVYSVCKEVEIRALGMLKIKSLLLFKNLPGLL